MTDRQEFARACGPTALAAIARINSGHAADLLYRLQWRGGQITVPGVSSHQMLIVLASLGFSAREFSTARSVGVTPMREPSELQAEVLESQFAAEAGFAAEYNATEAQPKVIAQPALVGDRIERLLCARAQQIETVELLTLAEVIELAAGVGTWLFVVGCSPEHGYLSHHAIAVRDGVCIAGDDPGLSLYRNSAALAAYEITRESA